MAICSICKTSYLSKECPECNNKNNGYNNQNEKFQIPNISIKKNNILIIIIATAVSIITIIMIRNEYIKHQEEKQIMKLIYGTDDYDEAEKINKKFMKQNEKTMKQLRNLYIPK